MSGKNQHNCITHTPLRFGFFPLCFLVMRTALAILLISLPCTFTFAARPDVAETAGRDRVDHDLGIRVEDGLVFLDVKDADIAEVLKEIARKARIDLTVDEELKEKSPRR